MLIVLRGGDIVPADCIPLKSSNPEGLIFLETAAIDGETNLKQVFVPPHFVDMPIEDIYSASGVLHCEYPHPKFDQFCGSIESQGVNVSISEKNLLIQGSVVRNTATVYALVCYCGVHTKLTLNQTPPKLKKSLIDHKFNIFVLVMVGVQTLICLVLAFLAGFRHSKLNDEDEGFWYLPKDDVSPAYYGFKKFFGYFTLISYIIPISCQVSLELSKFAQGLFYEQDEDMMIKSVDAKGKEVVLGMSAKSTGLNDELGMVNFVLSDKTGTLTENTMKFIKCSIGTSVFELSQLKAAVSTAHSQPVQPLRASGEADLDVETLDIAERTAKGARDSVVQFLMCMAMCNTVTIIDGVFSAQSPDEEALCDAAKACSVELKARTQKMMEVSVFGVVHKFSILAVFEFNSDRKRMSILVKDEDGNVELLSKGADNVMKELCVESPGSLDHIESFSVVGLRTLVLARRTISQDEFSVWYERYDDASNMLEGREDAMARLQDEMERDMTIIGVTAIEDKLQDGVPETIDMLLRGGIKVWVITGDKMETAINICKSCKLITNEYQCIAEDEMEKCGQRIEELRQQLDEGNLRSFTLVINARNCDWCTNDFKKDFHKLAMAAEGVVCCRVTPMQKAKITKCVKKMTHKVVLTVGDGANDVPMIVTGDVGVGIYGKEGTQAARASDFAIRKFRHLGKLVLYHGRCSLLRNEQVIKVCFYKNASFFLILLWYSFISNYTCQVVYDDYIMTFFNILFTQIQPILSGIFDRDLRWQTIRRYPECNREMLDGHRGGVKGFVCWFFYGVYQSLIFFFSFIWFIAPSDVSDGSGRSGGMIYSSVCITLYSMLSVIATLIVETKVWNRVLIFGHAISIVFIAIIYTFTCYVPGYSTYDISWNGYSYVFPSANFYLVCIISIVLSIAPLILKKFCERQFYPWFYQIAQEMESDEPLKGDYGTKREILMEGSEGLTNKIRSEAPLIPKNISKFRTSIEEEMSEGVNGSD